jgi:hypothetical protein
MANGLLEPAEGPAATIKNVDYFTVTCFLFSHMLCKLQDSRAIKVVSRSMAILKVIRGKEYFGSRYALVGRVGRLWPRERRIHYPVSL